MSGMFEVLAAAPDEAAIAQRRASQIFEAAVYDVREEFGPFLFQATSLSEFRDRVALVKPDLMKVVDRHLMPVSSVMGKIVTRSNSVLEQEFKQSFLPPQTQDDLVETQHPQNRLDEYHHTQRQQGEEEPQPLHVQTNRRRANPTPYDEGHVEGTQDAGRGRFNLQNHPRSSESEFADGYYKGYDNWAHPHEGARRRATGDGPALDTDVTFQDHQGETLEPEGDFKGYLNSVDQGADGKIDHNFVDNPDSQEHTGDPASTDFAKASKVTRQFAAFCRRNRLKLGLVTLERHGRKLTDVDYLTVAADLQRLGEENAWDYDDYGSGAEESRQRKPAPPVPETSHYQGRPGEPPEHRGAKRKQAAPDFLQKANDDLTGLLNQQAEQFQETIAPLQQALQIVQQQLVQQQAQNPLNVVPPAGTVNVLPDAPPELGQGAPGGLGGDPAAGGLDQSQGAPPPAAQASGADAGAGAPALPPSPDEQDPTQQLAAGRRGGHPKGRSPSRAGS